MTVAEYAEKHHLAEVTVTLACTEGRIPAVKHDGRGWGKWEIIGDPDWPKPKPKARPRFYGADKHLAATALGIMANRWRKGAEFQLETYREVYQQLREPSEVCTDICEARLPSHLDLFSREAV